MRCESSNCSIYVWIGDKENKQGEKESGNYYGCCSIGACVSDVDFAELCCRSIENADGTSKGVVAEQFATQLLLNEKDVREEMDTWI